MTHLAFAKINLGLHILARQPDGYHSIETVFHRVNISDRVSLAPLSTIEIETTSPGVPGDNTNIAHKAARLLKDHFGIHQGVKITLEKEIPIGAGLGGGSSDAGVVLRHLPAFWGMTIDDASLHRIALRLGSDVPYFLHDGSAIASGRGEIMEYLHVDIPFTILVCHPGINVSTSWAYKNIIPRNRRTSFASVLGNGMKNPALLTKELTNDFESLVFREHPTVRQIKEAMLDGSAVFALMSGSGSSVYGFFEEEKSAALLAGQLESQHFRTWITPSHFHPQE